MPSANSKLTGIKVQDRDGLIAVHERGHAEHRQPWPGYGVWLGAVRGLTEARPLCTAHHQASHDDKRTGGIADETNPASWCRSCARRWRMPWWDTRSATSCAETSGCRESSRSARRASRGQILRGNLYERKGLRRHLLCRELLV